MLYTAYQNNIYIVIVGDKESSNPSVNIQLGLIYTPVPLVTPPKDNITNTTNGNTTTNDTIVQDQQTIVNKTVYVTVTNKTSVFTQQPKPQVANLIIIGCILLGVGIYAVIECFINRKKTTSKDFDILDNFQFSERTHH